MITRLIKNTLKLFIERHGFVVVPAMQHAPTTWAGIKALGIDTVLDVGANEGQFAKKIGSAFPHAKIYSFEPLPEPFSILSAETGIKKTLGARFTPINVAIGAEDRTVEMHSVLNNSTISSLLAPTEYLETLHPEAESIARLSVESRRLDTLLQQGEIQLGDHVLLKSDTQGFEHQVLEGAPTVLQKSSACLLEVNFDSFYQGQAVFADIVAVLSSAGYRYAGNLEQSHHRDGHVMFADVLFVNRKNASSGSR